MSSEEKKPPLPPPFQEPAIVIQVPPNTSKQEIEKQIHLALIHQPDDIFRGRASKEVIIVVQQEKSHPPKTK
jgi:hypothetical protein